MAKDVSPSSVPALQESNGKGRNAPSIPLDNYVKVRSQKPSNGLSIAGIALGVVVPFSLLFTIEDTLDAIPFCGLFILIGSVLILIGVSRYSKWDKHMKSVRERIESEEGIPYPPTPQWPSIAATASLVGGFVLSDLEGIFFLLGGIIGLIFLGIQAYQLHNRNQAYDALINEMV